MGHPWILLIIVLAIVLIIFGPGKLSQLGGAVGKSIKDFRKSSSGADEPVSPRDNGSSSKPGSGPA
ncbi:MAG: twin-arginine translocase TatA/TatE family subunit [Candidatus Dormibacteraeota bacterium]|nr:twin-arginine translocase TatA/TatE family subunit [Candidatus Dormibacteraeota bacterium]